MGPVVTLSLVFLVGILSPWSTWPTTVGMLALALASFGGLYRGRSPLSAWLLVVATAMAGISRSEALRLPTPETLTADTLRIYGTVTARSLDDANGQRLAVRTPTYGAVDLHVTQGVCAARPGDRIDVVGTLRPIIPLRNPPHIDPDLVRVLAGTRFRLDASACTIHDSTWDPRDLARRYALDVRDRIDRALASVLPPQAVDQSRALLFGDTHALDPSARDAFRVSGLAHLLAVSGAHVALLSAALGGALQAVLKRIPPLAMRGIPARVAGTLPLPFVGFFILVTGESPSSVRALLTGTVSALATLVGRRPHGPSLVAGVACVMAAVSPSLLLDPGWQLSVGASFALAIAPSAPPPVAPNIVRAVATIFRDAWTASVRVAAAVTPLLAMLAGRAPATATVANVLAAPLGEVVLLPGTLLVAALGVFVPHALAALAGRVIAPLLNALFALPSLALRLPLASLALPTPTPGECLVATVCVLGALAGSWRRAIPWLIVGGLTVTGLEIVHRHSVLPYGVLRVTALDVGQGDAIFIDLPDGTGMLVDGGGSLTEISGPDPGARAVVPWLALHRRNSLVAVVLSHPHPDHAGGLSAVLQAVSVNALWDTGQGIALQTQGAYARLLAAAHSRNVPVVGPGSLCGPPRAFHGAMLQVLAPCPRPREEDPPNDASFAIRLSYGSASVFLPGDLERHGEARLISALEPTTLLKVPHHGSRTSSTEDFLRALQPRVALLSCGHPSPFGHPHPEVVDRYAAHGIELRRTDLSGAVSVTLYPDGSYE